MASTGPRSRPPAWRVAVAGGGPAGLVFALATARALREAVAITVHDPALGSRRTDGRAYAISPAAATLLEGLDLWPVIAGRVQPIRRMVITDSRVEDAIRPTYLSFGDGVDPLGFMVEASVLLPALVEGCRAAGVSFAAGAALGFDEGPRTLALRGSAGEIDTAHLLVAADGARSRLREAAGIAWFGRRYPQSGLVTTVSHANPHAGRATQHFLPGGPFAILPLPDAAGRHRSSIVWTERQERVAPILAAAPDATEAAVAERFARELGAIRLETPLAAFPLSVGLARRFVGPRVALLGDAAHEIHPLAGQGLNVGLGDAASLAERVTETVRVGLDPGAPEVLDRYERDRRFDAVALAAATDGLNRLFSNDRLPLRVLRDIGLGLVDRAPALKNSFAAQAGGRTARAPGTMRGG